MKSLETETETKIDLSETHVSVRGEDTTAVVAQLEKMLEAHKSEHAEVQITQDLIGRIIGAKGANIRKLGDESGARIDIDKVNMKVLIRGKEDQVQKAKAMIEEIVKDEAARRTQFVVPEEACPSIIGKGGETIRKIQGDTGTRLDIDRQTSRVTITGKPEDVIAAKALVEEVVEAWTKEREERRSKMIMERTREGEDGDNNSGRGGGRGGGRGRGRGGGRGGGRGRGRGNDKQAPAAAAEPEPQADTKPKLDEPRYISGMGPTRNQLKNKKRAQKRAKQRQEDEALDFLTSASSAGGMYSYVSRN